MTPRRVLAFAWYYLPFVGGAELFLKSVAERLRGRYEFTIVTARFRRGLPAIEDRPEGRVVRVGAGSAADRWSYLPLAPLRALRLPRPDVVHAVMASGGAFAAASYLKAAPRPSLLTLQDGDSEAYVRGYLGPLFPFYAPLHRRFDRVHAVSRFLAGRAVSYGVPADTVDVVPNGVDAAFLRRPEPDPGLRKQLGLGDDARVVISVSRLVLKNGIDRLVRAWPEVVRGHPAARLLLVGDGEDRGALEASARELGAAESVRFAGHVEPGQVPGYLALADVFVRPSLSEGLGSAFLEAMAAGVPVVGSREGGIPDFLEDGRTGLFCDPGRPATIAHAIKALLADVALRRRIANAGRELVQERYRWDVVAERIGELYDKVIESGRGRSPR